MISMSNVLVNVQIYNMKLNHAKIQNFQQNIEGWKLVSESNIGKMLTFS
uniref:BspA family leucine-rich repeat surface protein n=1 Tax=Rhizophora mucronata TaxID=61149 RepID=A0A2P2PVQ3_RHIMU